MEFAVRARSSRTLSRVVQSLAFARPCTSARLTSSLDVCLQLLEDSTPTSAAPVYWLAISVQGARIPRSRVQHGPQNARLATTSLLGARLRAWRVPLAIINLMRAQRNAGHAGSGNILPMARLNAPFALNITTVRVQILLQPRALRAARFAVCTVLRTPQWKRLSLWLAGGVSLLILSGRTNVSRKETQPRVLVAPMVIPCALNTTGDPSAKYACWGTSTSTPPAKAVKVRTAATRLL